MSTCCECGREIGDDALVCPFCGGRQVEPERPPAPGIAVPAELEDDGDPFRAPATSVLQAADGSIVAPRGAEVILLGRDPSSPIHALCDDNVSHRHANVRCAAAGLAITDCGSLNGTFIDGRRLDVGREYPLFAGDRVTLAADPPLTFTVVARDAAGCDA